MLAEGIGGVRKLVPCMVLALAAVGCRGTAVAPTSAPGEPRLLIRESPSPFTKVTAGHVRALILDDWEPRPAGDLDAPQHGFVASRPPASLGEARRPVEGMAAMWIDGTSVGVPSDYYYLAATGPAVAMLTHSRECVALKSTVIVDHRPTFAAGPEGSPGDYVARGQGVCDSGRRDVRWAYFVAAPGYGPVRQVGIPSSGLYVVVALLRDSPRAPELLDKLLLRTQFGDASVSDFIAAAQQA